MTRKVNAKVRLAEGREQEGNGLGWKRGRKGRENKNAMDGGTNIRKGRREKMRGKTGVGCLMY